MFRRPTADSRAWRPSRVRWAAVLTFSLLFAVSSQAKIRVDVSGVSNSQLRNVRAFLSIVKVSQGDPREVDALSDFAVSRLHNKAQKEIAEALRPFGYYAPQVAASLDKNGKDWIARYVIDRGEPTRLTRVDITLDSGFSDRAEIKTLLTRTQLKSGEILNHDVYTRLKQSLLRFAVSFGYLDARYRVAEIRVAPKSRTAAVTLDLDIGPVYYFGPIELNQDALDQSFAERFVTIREGEPFSTERLVAVQFDLNDSGYYKAVTVDAARQNAVDYRVPVTINARARESQRYTARVGVGTDTGPRVRFGAEFRRLNSRGNSLQSDFQLSSIKSSATARYSIPIKNVTTDKQTFYGRFDRAEIGDTDSDLYSLGARRYDHWRDLRRQLFVEFENELFTLGGEEETRSELLVFGASLAYQKADDALFTRRGMSARLEIHGAHTGLLSDTSFAKVTLSARAIYPLGEHSRVLLRTDIGATEVDNLADLPPSQRFFTGGDRTVRGYGFEQLSPLNADGESVGGRYLLSASVEADYFFNRKYGVAVFIDHGNAINDWSDTLKSGYGAGFRYRTPVGVLRVDAARPSDTRDDTFRLHLSIGPDL